MPGGKAIKFPQDVFNEAYAIELTDSLFEGRQLIEGITIDSRESKDLDDGINLYKKDGNFVVQVIIADVASVVTPETALFRESLARTATRYLSYSNVPMLPRILSENRLSLLPGELRPSITYNIEINSDCSIKNLEIRETVFKNRRRLSYQEFDDIIQNNKDDPDFNLFMECANLANTLMDSRKQKGAFAIYDLKRMIYTTEEGMVMPLRQEFAHISNIVIQEFMILTNKAVAQYHAINEIPLLYRNHTVRQNTPSREEILSQIETVIQNPQYINSLQGRASLWFNRATYDPVLKGHFGLNEPAYTHVTSPIRRVPDLINQLYTKAHLKGEAYPFQSEELEEISGQINEKILEIKDEKSKIFILKEQWQARLNLNYDTTERLVEMDANDFKKVLKEAIVHDLLLDNLEAALIKRMAENKLEAVHVYMLLFETIEGSQVWFDMKIKAIEYIYNCVGMPVSLLHLMAQNNMIAGFKTDVAEYKGGYAARIVAMVDDKEMTTVNYGAGKNKKEAQNKACYNFITSFINESLVPADDKPFEIPQQSLITPEVKLESIEENYIGILQEICIQSKGWEMPKYNFTMSGPSHQPFITCECVLQTPHLTLKAQGEGTSKRIAKHIASKKILELIEENKEILLEKSEAKSSYVPPNENYIGLVNDLCQKHQIKLPDFEFEQSGTASSPIFTCKATIQKDDITKEFTGTGTTKKTSKQDAAFKCYIYLSGLVGGMIAE